MKRLCLLIGTAALLGSCNMVSEVQKSTTAIKDNRRAVTAATSGISENRDVVVESSVAIRENLEAVETSTEVIRRNAEVVQRSTDLLDKLHFDEGPGSLLVIALLAFLFGVPLSIVAYLAQINRKMVRVVDELNKCQRNIEMIPSWAI